MQVLFLELLLERVDLLGVTGGKLLNLKRLIRLRSLDFCLVGLSFSLELELVLLHTQIDTYTLFFSTRLLSLSYTSTGTHTHSHIYAHNFSLFTFYK